MLSDGVTIFAKIDTMPSPSRVSTAGDSGNGYRIAPLAQDSAVPGLAAGAVLRHSGKLNMSFVDGHAEMQGMEQLRYWPSGDLTLRFQKPWY